MSARHEPYIKQGDYGRWCGCYVQVPGCIARLFSYSNFATTRECLADAVEYRNACVEQIGGFEAIPKRAGGRLSNTQIFRRASRANALGILGVHVEKRWRKQKARNGRRAYRRLMWNACAQIQLPGGSRRKQTFSVPLYGIDEAVRLAIGARARFEQERDRMLKAQRASLVALRRGLRDGA